MWWKRQTVNPNEALIQMQREHIQYLMLQHDTDSQRIDRLMEALARRANVDLVMPMPTPIAVSVPIPLPNPWKDPNHVTGEFPQLRQKPPVTSNFKETKTQ